MLEEEKQSAESDRESLLEVLKKYSQDIQVLHTNNESLQTLKANTVPLPKVLELPETEYTVYWCHGSLHNLPGYVYVTPKYFSWVPWQLVSKDRVVKLELKDITSLNKVSGGWVKANTILEVASPVSDPLLFRNIYHREELCSKILNQATLFGHSICLMRDSKEVNEEWIVIS
eukprot:TRINITY_DN5369_c0_g1_i2.p1 TRINITY_DN5369_c0_g1~~TRINITY_DN5369_c0_g1_i2.p1  ORF type:complete len:173 (-),score=26.01 TRINITY_DN5369_c0_g1_i2:30-548(-)